MDVEVSAALFDLNMQPPSEDGLGFDLNLEPPVDEIGFDLNMHANVFEYDDVLDLTLDEPNPFDGIVKRKDAPEEIKKQVYMELLRRSRNGSVLPK
ncbi:hypothetical protein ZEAMMB73_Zm00001d034354, partial [Zea mays]